ncbi:complement factor D-like [Echeneis naucrates]|uniref:trypsin n=1 Tax=Echeneis naucrates TaxID=173247 RepID=A0A665VAY3_ECHNA|nr:complement factor D-like [Echeneis naucrates]XP_029350057.1 complement factor D-like [Echeneis naucrates]
MVSGKEVLVAAAVFAVALISHSEGIMGGREAVAHSRPYMASIQVPEGNRLKHICGGFVVADQWVMTAAHCLPNEPDGRKVVLGMHSLSQPEATKQTFDILRIYNNPTFNPLNYDNDIALILLDRPFVPSEAVKAVPFLRAGGTNPTTDDEVDTAGWGASNNLGSRPDALKELFIDVYSPGLCGNSNHFGSKFTQNMMCAHRVCPKPCPSRIRKEDTCDGDSGGPLLFNGVVVGITSNGGRKCGQLRKPGIYTIVSHYTDWIDATMAQQPAAAAAEPSS